MSQSNLLPQGGFNRMLLAREGYVLYNANDVYIGQAIERYGEYGEIEAQLLRQLVPRGGVAIEVGANIGTHTLVLAHAAGPGGFVYAYEPQRVVFQALCANLALNSIVHVDARHAAAGSAAGWVLIPDIDYTRTGNFGGVSVDRFESGRRVRRVALDGDLEPARLDLVKIDVEGMELDTLLGAAGLIARFRPALYVENDRLDRSEALIRHLHALDYRLYWHLPPLYNPENFFGERENLYPGIVSVNMLGLPRARPQSVQGLPEITDPADHPMKHRPASER
ncbi:MAG: FkbM family methyltransferase [Burkholderiales bacterium]|nr:FkbM family methyltransferase [Burkholderiales bacterium]